MKSGRRGSGSRISDTRSDSEINLSVTRGEQDGHQRDELQISTRDLRVRDLPPTYGPLSPTSQNTLVRKGRANSSGKMKKVDLLRSFELQLAIM